MRFLLTLSILFNLFISTALLADDSYLVNLMPDNSYIGCLYSNAKFLDTFVFESELSCRERGAQKELKAWKGESLNERKDYLKVNEFSSSKEELNNDVHQELKNTLKKLRNYTHYNGDNGCNHRTSYYGFLFFKFVSNLYINMTSVAKIIDAQRFHHPADYLDDEKESFISQSLITFLDSERTLFENPSKTRNLRIKLVSQDNKIMQELKLHRDECDYLSTYFTSAELEGGDLNIYSSTATIKEGKLDQRGLSPVQEYKAESSELLASIPCRERARYTIREGNSCLVDRSRVTTHSHSSWKNMRERDLLIVRFWDTDHGINLISI